MKTLRKDPIDNLGSTMYLSKNDVKSEGRQQVGVGLQLISPHAVNLPTPSDCNTQAQH